MHNNLIHTENTHEQGQHFLYRITIPVGEVMNLHERIMKIRPNQSKIMRIEPEDDFTVIEIILSSEELTFLKLSVKITRCRLLEEWDYKKWLM